MKSMEEIVNEFNQKHPVGSTVKHRSVGIKNFPYKDRIVAKEAFLNPNNEPVCFFKGLSSYYSILPEFLES